jgi:hypothetical protein
MHCITTRLPNPTDDDDDSVPLQFVRIPNQSSGNHSRHGSLYGVVGSLKLIAYGVVTILLFTYYLLRTCSDIFIHRLQPSIRKQQGLERIYYYYCYILFESSAATMFTAILDGGVVALTYFLLGANSVLHSAPTTSPAPPVRRRIQSQLHTPSE